MKLLVISGGALILLSIATGWLIIAKKYLSLEILEKLIRNDGKLVKAHIDYIMMSLILFAFFLTGVTLPFPVVVLACVGALADPSLFVFLSIRPDVNKNIGTAFSVISTTIFLITTAGIGGGAFYIIMEQIK
jgi:hypothetical protein